MVCLFAFKIGNKIHYVIGDDWYPCRPFRNDIEYSWSFTYEELPSIVQGARIPEGPYENLKRGLFCHTIDENGMIHAFRFKRRE